MAIIARAELVGKSRNRNFYVEKGGEATAVSQQRMVRVGQVFNEETGEVGYIPARRLLRPIDEVPHLPLALSGRIFTSPFQKPSLSTARKEGASTPFVDTKKSIKQRGGDNKSPLKTGGFSLASTAREMIKERQRKKLHAEQMAAQLAEQMENPYPEFP